MRSKHLSVALLAVSLACAGTLGLANEAAHGKPAGARSGVTDEQAVEHAMKALFDKPQSPLKVAAVSVEGDYALAGWIQDQRGGRALLKKDHGKWMIHLCGGDGLKAASYLAQTGMSAATANRPASRMAAVERKLPADQVAKFAMFDGVVKVDGAGHGAHAAGHAAVRPPK